MSNRLALVVFLSAGVASAASGAEPTAPGEIVNWPAPLLWKGQRSVAIAGEPSPGEPGWGLEQAQAAPTPLPLIAVAPCRVADTRKPAGPYGAPALAAGVDRVFTLTGQCGIAATAQAVSLNISVTNTLGPGFITIYPQGTARPQPLVSTLNYRAAQTIANAAIAPLGTDGGVSILAGISGTDLIVDVNGYYDATAMITQVSAGSGLEGGGTSGEVTLGIAPGGVTATELAANAVTAGAIATGQAVKSVNGLNDAVTLAAGSNVTITPSGNTLTIATSGVAPTGPAGGGLTGTYPNPSVVSSSGNLPGTIVSRSASGDFSTNSISLAGTLSLPSTSASGNAGVINLAGERFLHAFGEQNVFLGIGAGNFANFTGANTAAGYHVLTSSTGSANSAFGSSALESNLDGELNSAFGSNALFSNSSGNENSALGSGAMFSNTAGSENTAVGSLSLGLNTTGSYNVAVGYRAGNRGDGGIAAYGGGTVFVAENVTGSFNAYLGGGTGATATDVSNCTAVGTDAYCDGSNQVRLGNAFVTSIGGKVGWSALSDARAKTNIRDISLGLDFVLQLRPVEYELDRGNGRTDMGFVAQDVEQLLGETHNLLTVGGDPDRTLSLRYADLIAPLVKAVQEQNRTIERQSRTIEDLRDRVRALEEGTRR